MDTKEEDESTQKTAIDALSCKFSAYRLGYIQDEFIQYFFKKNCIRKSPIINRGYFARTECISSMLQAFLSITDGMLTRQIIHMGIGFDTLSLSLIKENHSNLKIFEIDFDDIIHRKASIMVSEPAIRSVLQIEQLLAPSSTGENSRGRRPSLSRFQSTHTGCYQLGEHLSLLSADIRRCEKVVEVLQGASIDPEAPTIIVTECVLVYLDRAESMNLTSRISSFFSNVSWVTYDMINPQDTFGRVMKNNLQVAGYHIPGFVDFGSIDLQRIRFLQTGWSHVNSCTMLSAYNRFISGEKKTKIQKLEIFDEIEEWEMLMAHYSFTVAVKTDQYGLEKILVDLPWT